jgi:Cu2+-exporting ATPase
LPVPLNLGLTVSIAGIARPMCCHGCAAVARAIVDSGLEDFYHYRTGASATGHEPLPDFMRQAAAYDHPAIQRSFVRTDGENIREASLILEGIVCAACVWLNERHIATLPGMLEVRVNYSTHRAHVRWDEARIRLSEIITAISRIGYRAHPYDPQRQELLLEEARRCHIRRMGVAGILGMQIMILAVALYAGAWWGMEAQFRTFFRWLSLALALPVVGYSALPFFQSAWRDIKNLRPGMDVPVSLGIGTAFVASAWATIHGAGHVYYDSVVMFVFFLLTARYFELAARKRAAERANSLVHLAPAMATRLVVSSRARVEQLVPVHELTPGDHVLVRPGDTVPADGRVLEGRSSVDESLLTGESAPRKKSAGQLLVGGSVNIESPLIMKVEKVGQDTRLAAIIRLLDRAQSEKPLISRLADRAASWFVSAVLLLAAAVAAYWWHADAAQWLPITIAVLVVTCPCALSLATPTAMTAATGELTRLGLLATRGHAVETLARATHFLFDKTGTLTRGGLHLVHVRPLAQMDTRACLRQAASLERHSEHPIARAMVAAAPDTHAQAVSQARATPGAGITGQIDGQPYIIGAPEFVQARTGLTLDQATLSELRADGHTVIVLASHDALQAAFALTDEVRPGARELIDALRRSGRTVWLLTGDHERAARRVADQVGINNLAWGLAPEEKLEKVKVFQAQGGIVAMMGDGINDAPVLAQAQVSIAMGGGTQLAAASADMILLSERLPHLATGVRIARKTLRIIGQNLMWAVTYNIVALPAAALGYIAPWMAAVGMSASSLLVVANALRLIDNRNPEAGLTAESEAHDSRDGRLQGRRTTAWTQDDCREAGDRATHGAVAEVEQRTEQLPR